MFASSDFGVAGLALEFVSSHVANFVTDFPTVSAQAEALILQCVALNKWKLVSGDIKTASLSGDEEHRNIFIVPPDDVVEILVLSPDRVNAETPQSCLWSRERPEEMVGSVVTITSESWIHILCVGSVFVLVKQRKRGVVFTWTTCWEEVMKCLTEPF